MKEAIGEVYGRYGSPLTIVFGPVIAPRTYLRALHLLLMFPLGIAYFVGLVVTLTVGGAMIWTIVGPVVLIMALYLSRWSGHIANNASGTINNSGTINISCGGVITGPVVGNPVSDFCAPRYLPSCCAELP